uniref:Uncharacterized protein n=1 Tax=Lepeophtheirus salmonis TaxID=72036 RepID=A0A0K2U622_LEPSM
MGCYSSQILFYVIYRLVGEILSDISSIMAFSIILFSISCSISIIVSGNLPSKRLPPSPFPKKRKKFLGLCFLE